MFNVFPLFLFYISLSRVAIILAIHLANVETTTAYIAHMPHLFYPGDNGECLMRHLPLLDALILHRPVGRCVYIIAIPLHKLLLRWLH